jgi:hypothetical protein
VESPRWDWFLFISTNYYPAALPSAQNSPLKPKYREAYLPAKNESLSACKKTKAYLPAKNESLPRSLSVITKAYLQKRKLSPTVIEKIIVMPEITPASKRNYSTNNSSGSFRQG